MRFPNFQFDRLSFLLGLVTATAFWWLLGAIRPMLPVWRERIGRAVQAFRQRNLAGAQGYLLRETLRRAQRSHLAASLFSLDEILIAPRLMAQPPQFVPGGHDNQVIPFAAQLLPYLPDWPQLTCPLGAPTLTLSQAVQLGSPIAIIGQPGTGKSVTLAHYAAQLARPAPFNLDAEAQPVMLPLYLHIFDLDTNLTPGSDPLDALRRAIIRLSSVIAQPQVTRYLQTVFDSRMSHQYQPILLLDGLDELSPEELRAAAQYLRALLRQHPTLRAVVTAADTYIDGLAQAGFVPLVVASWSAGQRVEFLEQWSALWVTQYLPEVRKSLPDLNLEPLLLNNWLLNEIGMESPLEWTLKVWSAYAGDLNGSGAAHLLETFIQRHIAANYRESLDLLARKWINRTTGSLPFDQMEEILSGMSISEPLSAILTAESDSPPATKKKRQGKLAQDTRIVSQGERIIGILLNAGLMVRHSGGKIRMVNPVLLGYLAAARLAPEDCAALTAQLHWPAAAQALRFVSAASPQPTWIVSVLQAGSPPLYTGLLSAARWLPDVPLNADWRALLMRQLVGLLQTEDLPFGARARCAAALVASGDPSAAKLFAQLLTARSPFIRRLAVMACGASGLAAHLNEILGLLADRDLAVRNTACLAIGALPGEMPLNTIVEIMMQSDEELRQIAAEALAMRPKDGHALLEEALTANDLLARRAAVSGLLQIRTDWSHLLLEKVAVEDSQWIVRNAATVGLEAFEQNDPFLPRPLPPPADSPWLLNFASRNGMGIQPDEPATEILLAALENGTPDEQLAALEYLRSEANQAVMSSIDQSMTSGPPELQEPALSALWWASISGS